MAEFGAVLDSETDVQALPEPVRKQFAQGEDGKWHQKVPDPNEDTTALKNGLESERERAKRLEKQAADAAKKLDRYKGIDPDEYAALKQQAEEAEQAKLKAEGKEQELWERKRLSLEEAHKTALAERDAKLTEMQTKLDRILIDDRAVSVVAGLPGFKNTPKAVELLKRIARDELKVDGEDAVPIDREGNPRLVAGRTMTVKEWGEGLVSEYGDILFEGSNGGGATNGKGGTPSGKRLKDMTPAEKAAAMQSVSPQQWAERVASEYSN